MTEPTLSEVHRLVEKIDERTERIEEAMFVGQDGQPPLLSRVATLEERTARVPITAGLGAAIGSAIVVVLGYLGIRPPGQQ